MGVESSAAGGDVNWQWGAMLMETQAGRANYLCHCALRPSHVRLNRKARQDRKHMNGLTIFGLVAVSLMLLFYALEDRGSWARLGFACACGLGSVYGFLQGAWPFGVVEAIWSLVALRRFALSLRAPNASSR